MLQHCVLRMATRITEVDSYYFDFYGIGDYYLVKHPSAKLVVQARQDKCAGVSCNFGVAVKYESSVVTILVDDSTGKPSVNVLSEELQAGIKILTLSKSSYAIYLPDGAVVKCQLHWWGGGQTYYMNIQVSLPGSYYDNVDGLCGNWDGNHYNDASSVKSSYRDSVHRAHRPESIFYWPNCVIPGDQTSSTSTSTGIAAGSDYYTCNAVAYDAEVELEDAFEAQNDIGLDDVTDITDVIAAAPKPSIPEKVFDETFVPNDQPTFETPEFQQEAETVCGELFATGGLALACHALGVDTTTYYDSCIFDAQVTQTLDMCMEGIDILHDECQYVVEEIVDTAEADDDNDDVDDNAEVTAVVTQLQHYCPSACSGHGTCVAHQVCVCASGYWGDDCSLNADNTVSAPVVDSFTPQHIQNGGQAMFEGDGMDLLVEPQCRFSSTSSQTQYTVTANVISLWAVTCTVPDMGSEAFVGVPTLLSGSGGGGGTVVASSTNAFHFNYIVPNLSTSSTGGWEFVVAVLHSTAVRCQEVTAQTGGIPECYVNSDCGTEWTWIADIASLEGYDPTTGYVYGKTLNGWTHMSTDGGFTWTGGQHASLALAMAQSHTAYVPSTVSADNQNFLTLDGGSADAAAVNNLEVGSQSDWNGNQWWTSNLGITCRPRTGVLVTWPWTCGCL